MNILKYIEQKLETWLYKQCIDIFKYKEQKLEHVGMTRVFANVCSVGSDESAHLLKLTSAFTRLCDQYPIYWHIYNTCLERYNKSTR